MNELEGEISMEFVNVLMAKHKKMEDAYKNVKKEKF
jgi:hypothetical protein